MSNELHNRIKVDTLNQVGGVLHRIAIGELTGEDAVREAKYALSVLDNDPGYGKPLPTGPIAVARVGGRSRNA